MKDLVTLWKRPSYDGETFTYYLLYTDEQCRRRQKSLRHSDARKAERQRAQFERDLRMNVVESGSMKLSEFLKDSFSRTRGQVRESTLYQARIAMEHFIEVIGDVDYSCIRHSHGELFVQSCLDTGNSPATVAKKIRHLKRIFQLAVERGQLEDNPLRCVKQPRRPRRKVRVFSKDECCRLLRAAKAYQGLLSANKRRVSQPIEWELLIKAALCTGMRRGELLNTTWKDIDFERKTIDVTPKRETVETWEWNIKDTDRRTLPLTDEMVHLFAEHQARQAEGYPYVFIPARRYDNIQQLRKDGQWTIQLGANPINNFDRQFRIILKMAGIGDGEFHDLRRTCLSNWFANGLREYDVTTMAGHASFETTRQFYLAVSGDLIERTREASGKAMEEISVANLLQMPFRGSDKKDHQP